MDWSSLPDRPPERQRYGVFLTDFSFTKNLRVPGNVLLDVNTASFARKLIYNIRQLLLVFDVVHVPLAQFYFVASPYFQRVASHMIRDPTFQFLARSGLISTTFQATARSTVMEMHADDHARFGWIFSDPVSKEDLIILTDLTRGFNFDNNRAAANASGFLYSTLDEYESLFLGKYAAIRNLIDKNIDDNAGAFMMEAFLPAAKSIDLDADAWANLLDISNKAYYVNPNHLITGPSDTKPIIFLSYDDRVRLSELLESPGSPFRFGGCFRLPLSESFSQSGCLKKNGPTF